MLYSCTHTATVGIKGLTADHQIIYCVVSSRKFQTKQPITASRYVCPTH